MRLSYNVIVEYGYKFEDIDRGEKNHILTGRMIDSYFHNIVLGGTKVTSIKPYLRTMSSMTEAEIEELKELTGTDEVTRYGFSYQGLISECFGMMYDDCSEIVDWLNAHHFDYRGLIEKGLAIEAPEGMYGF